MARTPPRRDEQTTNISAEPTKKFIVDSLTRDIELDDAILDLLDNCIDGLMRVSNVRGKIPGSYEGFHASIEFSSKIFQITDNCGGIPKDIAINTAFRLGRLFDAREEEIPTIGIYGVGMKRALFKIGRTITVFSQTADFTFQVKIGPDWLTSESGWALTLKELPRDPKFENGTKIEIRNLRKDVSNLFNANGEAHDSLLKKVSSHYSYIIQKGFSVSVNGRETTPQPLALRFVEDSLDRPGHIAPYLFRGVFDGVQVELAVGMYRPPPSEDEIEDEQGASRRAEFAGWTIVCNDRVIVYNDKTYLTGWGEANVPRYHNQFIAISGIVYFTSTIPELLPIGTTKRGLNANSLLYLKVKNRMREGTKLFTDYTNRWKKHESEERKISESATSAEITSVIDKVSSANKWTQKRDSTGGEVFQPKLPTPSSVLEARETVRFSRPKEDVRRLARALFDNPDAPPSEVGGECFDRTLKEFT